MVAPKRVKAAGTARCPRSRSLQRDGLRLRRERPGRHRSALQWPAELREWRLYLWFGGHGGQGARSACVAAQAATVGRAATRQRADDGSVSLLRGDDVIATAVPRAVEAQAPPAPTVEQAEIATRRYVGFAHHRFPTCFVCGTAREDSLRICAGQVGDSPLIASPWTPESDDPVFAGQCPTAQARTRSNPSTTALRALSSPRSPSSSVSRPRAGERHVVAAWPVSSDGRKHHSASALYDATGCVLAIADSLWIELRDPAAFGG